MNIQFKKGVLELFVLAMLKRNDQYGYDISDYISKQISISPGTVYPILRKLKDEGIVTTYLSEQSSGPARKYYQLTKKGHDKYESLSKEWNEFINITKFFLEEKHE
ncbi:MAG: PadR family transcriptional regulator [Tenericutes bacterium GWC2_39_45]|jgi:PadR family transcriptional regulator PadR|nr:MAG: PadR family transcriptional regulator [Tenericutes bacterium GWA2_38_26]OHE30654.1 MAG: PadR family transcriptional regulator [Tenericutes bacterium GWC2_39_45]OHE31846.1 MAG: PadR family transcriptional regulator [Tenericutes bacterium GWD2_38_27]OHE35155.1 MAG: PadR family transcriptional regulator [Tenericutes bacterium GWE2_38_8]OHE40417.1 MAG: PadR family transcriptional regulator [Tenericutes bacterium GWF2_38_8]HBG33459.1 PadR family transcriptional regulator [Acholeplasmataceae